MVGREGFKGIEEARLYPKAFFKRRLRSLGIDGRKFDCALMPAADYARLREIAARLDQSSMIRSEIGEPVYMGRLGKLKVLALNSGIGGPHTSLTLETLIHAGVRYFIRVGSAGALKTTIRTGDIVIPTGAVRGEGTSREYIMPEFPAAADPTMLSLLKEAAGRVRKQKGTNYHLGITWTHDGFFAESSDQIEFWSKANVLAVEMEVATLFTIASLRGVKAAAVLAVTDNMIRGREKSSVYTSRKASSIFMAGSRAAASIAVHALRKLSEQRSNSTG